MCSKAGLDSFHGAAKTVLRGVLVLATLGKPNMVVDKGLGRLDVLGMTRSQRPRQRTIVGIFV